MAQHSNYGLDFDLGETAEMIRNTVSAFSQAEIAPRAAEIDKSNEFPRDLWPRMGELGLHGITVEEEYGGLGLGYLDHAGMSQFCRSIAAALRPGGRWLIETCAAAESLLPTLQPEREYTLGAIHVHSRNKYLAEQSCLETTYECTRDGQTQSFRNWHFVFTAAEIRRMLIAAGFQIVGMYGTSTGESYALGNSFLYLVSQKSPQIT